MQLQRFQTLVFKKVQRTTLFILNNLKKNQAVERIFIYLKHNINRLRWNVAHNLANMAFGLIRGVQVNASITFYNDNNNDIPLILIRLDWTDTDTQYRISAPLLIS